jgi:HPt (histidine-containing phosphotransfer) domain-containing protein
MLERLGGDDELMRDVLEVFLDECPRMMDELRGAVAGGDSQTLERAAHSMKGALLNISADPAAEAAQTLERIGTNGGIDKCSGALAVLEQEIDRLQHALTSHATPSS